MADTIFALSSGHPPAAVSVIRISGPAAHDVARQLAGSIPEPRFASVRALHDPLTGGLLDTALLLRFDGPASATGEDVLELQCHGGRAVVDSLLSSLERIDGLRRAEPGEFTRRAFENGRIDLTEAEGLADLLEAETETQRKAALALAEGGLRRQIAEWQSRLLAITAQVEAAIDYDDDDVAIDPSVSAECAALANALGEWVSRPLVEPLKAGLSVVVAGPPNAGKSSLINALSGEDRVIVTDVPGTTRDFVEVPLSLDGIPIRLTDTAGLRDSDDRVESIGIERAAMKIESADVLLWLGDHADAPDHPRTIIVTPKCDLLDSAAADAEAWPVSSVTGVGIPALLKQVRGLARSLLPAEGALALNRRQAQHLSEAESALAAAARAGDPVIVAEELRAARSAFDRLGGRAGIEDVLDALFGRFCLGK